MKLYIQVENGQPVEHPATEENLLQAFPDGIPSNWEPFVRVLPPSLNEHEMFDDPHVIYEKIDGVWTDVHQVIQVSEEERIAIAQAKKQREIDFAKAAWAALRQRDNFSAWVFNEDTMKYEPPIPRPTDREVIWSGANNGWVDRPTKPDDGKNYRIDFYTSSWVEVTE
jgi:hypothetical protein